MDLKSLWKECYRGLVNYFRADEHRKDFEMNEDLDEKLIGQAPHTENRFIKVRSVLNKK